MSNIETKLSVTTRFLAGVAVVISALAIIGWLTNSLDLAKVKASYIPMAPAAAGIFLIFSAVLIIALSFLKCETIQGFLLSKPLPAAEMGDLIREKNDFLKKRLVKQFFGLYFPSRWVRKRL